MAVTDPVPNNHAGESTADSTAPGTSSNAMWREPLQEAAALDPHSSRHDGAGAANQAPFESLPTKSPTAPSRVHVADHSVIITSTKVPVL